MSEGAGGLERIGNDEKVVDIGGIERELTQLWQTPESEAPATRACMSNLIIYAPNQAEASAIPQEIASIVARHPSRVLLLVGEAGGGGELEAHVSALCHLGSGGSQICSEHVTIEATGRGLQRLAAVVRPLLIGDLPTALWWTPSEAPSSGSELFGQLSSMANQVIYDSMGWPDPVRGMLATADWVEAAREKQVISDLAWRRLKPLRRLICQSLDPAVIPGALDTITEVEIVHTPHALPQSWLLVGWLSRLLGWQAEGGKVKPGVEVSWGFKSGHGPIRVTAHRLAEGKPQIQKVVIRWQGEGGPAAARFEAAGPDRLSFEYEGTAAQTRYMAMPSQRREDLVARQLQKLFRDALFRDTVSISRTMAEALTR